MEVPVPSPQKNEVLVKVEATSINPVDWKIQKAMLRPFLPRKFPFIPGDFWDSFFYIMHALSTFLRVRNSVDTVLCQVLFHICL